ncbi:hypothetical protein HZA97_03880 [Candidatus Woesearchaeota archaeon]|nr:hypothetical protein [Candidatus Woesearchaeota archaeon]
MKKTFFGNEKANKFVSAFLLASSIGSGLFFYDQHNKLEKTKSELEETTQELANTKTAFNYSIKQCEDVSGQLKATQCELEQAILLGEDNYESLLREVVKNKLTSYVYPLHLSFPEEDSHVKAVSRIILGRNATQKESSIILDEVRKAKQDFYDNGGFRK